MTKIGCTQHDCDQCTGTMKLITSIEQVEPGREYWLRSKRDGSIERCYLRSRAAMEWAMRAFDIIGPIPEQEAPDFDAYIRAHAEWEPSFHGKEAWV